MIELFLILTLSSASHEMPAYFDDSQREIANRIIKEARSLKEDPYVLVALAWQESRIVEGRMSHTRDVGIFQINWDFWGKKIWKYKSLKEFSTDMNNPEKATQAAVMVLNEMRRYKACDGSNIYACYNGGPNWKRSMNIDKIVLYTQRVCGYAQRFKRYRGWRG